MTKTNDYRTPPTLISATWSLTDNSLDPGSFHWSSEFMRPWLMDKLTIESAIIAGDLRSLLHFLFVPLPHLLFPHSDLLPCLWIQSNQFLQVWSSAHLRFHQSSSPWLIEGHLLHSLPVPETDSWHRWPSGVVRILEQWWLKVWTVFSCPCPWTILKYPEWQESSMEWRRRLILSERGD